MASQCAGPSRPSGLVPPDMELVARVRGGDSDAFDLLYRRHREAALRHARGWIRPRTEAEDLCAEAFTRVLFAIRRGCGPRTAFLAYLLATMRHAAWDWAFDDHVTCLVLAPDRVELFAGRPDRGPVGARSECSPMAAAFDSLPDRWRKVLWQTEIEDAVPSTLAAQWGMSASAVAALAYRARAGLRRAYLRAYADGDPAEKSEWSCSRGSRTVRPW